jgi:N-acetylmuramic acid 6-phosphate etherase
VSLFSQQRSAEFLKISGQFKLGALVTEASHPVTANLSTVAQQNISAGLKQLFQADHDVLRRYEDFVKGQRMTQVAALLAKAIRAGGRIFFTGCGSTGRLSILLDSIWRDFWQQQSLKQAAYADDFENRTFSVMAGGDYALIKSVEGFEDFSAFGRKQMTDLAVSSRDVVFAITEGGETSFVIGTAWAGIEAGAKVYFVYNNPDDILCQTVERSRQVIEDARIEKINLTTGPMSITGSTRMQATSVQLAVMSTILEMTVRDLLGVPSATVPEQVEKSLGNLFASLNSPAVLDSLSKIVALEEGVYRSGHKNNYFADALAVDVLTDTTERSPTFCTPAFRKFDDTNASPSWAFLFVPRLETPAAWRHILKRAPRCIEWSDAEVNALAPAENAARSRDIIRKIKGTELNRFRTGLDGLPARLPGPADSIIAVVSGLEMESLLKDGGFFQTQLAAAHQAGAQTGMILFGSEDLRGQMTAIGQKYAGMNSTLVFVPVPKTDLLLDGVARVGAKLVMNAISTCTMVRLGRVLGNYMIWVVPSNLKLIDRSTRYIHQLTGLNYEAANALLFEIIEYIEPRMKADQAYPPVVGMAVLRAREHLTNQEAEERMQKSGNGGFAGHPSK